MRWLTSLRQNISPRLKDLKQNGTPEIIIGTGLLSVFAYDYYLQNPDSRDEKNEKSPDEIRRGFEAKRQILDRLRDDIERDAAKVDFGVRRRLSDDDDDEGGENILFSCRVVRVPAFYDGYKSLQGTRVGDVVQVLKENVGPSGHYHLCRLITDARIEKLGWFPISHLNKIEAE